MTYIIAEPCIDIKDRSCIDVCPVDCIHEADRMLVIDPEECIDCGACEPECPVEAIFPEDALPEKWEPFVRINYAYGEGFDGVNRLVDALGGAAAALAYGVEGPAPPAELRDRILVRARQERPNVVPLRPRRNLTAWATAAAAAAACAAIGLGVWAATLNGSLGRERSAAGAQRAALALLADPAARRI